MHRLFALMLTFSFVFFYGCSGSSVPEGRILVKNDSRDRTYNVIQVSAGGANYTLKPGEEALLRQGTRFINISRRYERYTRTYQVECPSRPKNGVVIKLIDVHVNRIAGGCKTLGGGKK